MNFGSRAYISARPWKESELQRALSARGAVALSGDGSQPFESSLSANPPNFAETAVSMVSESSLYAALAARFWAWIS
jgi:hypothetical protein